MQLQDIPSTFLAALGLPSSFCAVKGPSINFRQISVLLYELLSTFLAAAGPSSNYLCCHWTFQITSMLPLVLSSTSVNFLSHRDTFRQFLSTFCVATGPSINFLCGRGTFCQLSIQPRTFCQLFVPLHNHPSTFHATTGPSFHSRQLSEPPWHFPSTSVDNVS